MSYLHHQKRISWNGFGPVRGIKHGLKRSIIGICIGTIGLQLASPAYASFIKVTKLGGSSTLNGRPAFVGDQLIKQGDNLASSAKSWIGMFFAARAHATIGSGSAIKVRSISANGTSIAITGIIKIKIQTGGKKIDIGGSGAVTRTLGTTFAVSAAKKSHCAAVESGEVQMTTDKGHTQIVSEGLFSCSFDGGIPTAPMPIDKEMRLSVADFKVIDGLKFCTVKIALGNTLWKIDGEKGESLGAKPDGLYGVNITNPQEFRVMNPLGEFVTYAVKAC